MSERLKNAGFVIVTQHDEYVDEKILKNVMNQDLQMARLLHWLGYGKRAFQAIIKPMCHHLIIFQHNRRVFLN